MPDASGAATPDFSDGSLRGHFSGIKLPHPPPDIAEGVKGHEVGDQHGAGMVIFEDFPFHRSCQALVCRL